MNKIKSLILPVSLIILIAAVCFYRLYFLQAGKINFPELFIIITYIIWMIFEAKVSLSECSQKKTFSDFHTREIYATGQALTILSAIWFSPSFISLSIKHEVGIILFIPGILLRVISIKTLGKYYSHSVMMMEDHEIIDKGPYRFIRHPAYGGMILAHCGILLFFFNYITLIIFLILLIPAIVLRIIIEEKTLFNITGYKEFAIKRKKIIPDIW